MDIQFGNLSQLNLLWIVAIAVAAMILGAVARRRAAARFATANLLGRMQTTGTMGRQALKAALVTGAMLALVLALVDIRWGKIWREVPQKGIEVMFVLDVSRSMLAEDVKPSRLERAKQQIGDMLEAMAGDRVGLVAFAGEARQLVPLTSHYQDFQQTLRDIGPQNLDRGGSRLGDALRLAASGFLDQTGDHKAVVVFTDGEDQESQPVQAAEQLYRDHGIRIFTVGLGDMDQGARIPERKSGRQQSYLQYQGQQVWSKMNGTVLKQVALATDGAYVPAGTKQVDMAQVYHSFLANVDQQDFETARINSYVPRYPWFVGLGLLLLTIDTLLPSAYRSPQVLPSSRRKWTFRSIVFRSGKTVERVTRSERKMRTAGKSAAAACLALLLLLPTAASAVEPSNIVHRANVALRAGNLDQALADYEQAAQTNRNRPELLYNQAVVHYRKGDYQQARQLLAQAASTADERLDARVRYNLANCDYAEAVQLADQDKSAAISKLQSAIANYRDTLAINSADTDARANIQTAQMLIDKLQQEENQKEQQQKQPQQDKTNDQQDGDDASQNEKADDAQKQDAQKQDGQEQDRQEDEKSDQQSTSPQPDSSSEASRDVKADQNPDKQESQGSPRDPSDAESQTQQQAGQQAESGPPSDGPQVGQGESTATADARPMTQEEAQKLLQAVRDRELRRRLEQRRKAQRYRVPVDRDW